ncbi:hypothetical protein Moror_9812 [Moniliophthora roreri MCA 2997]|uniref:F-box domain-containing protein n=1 Tax=Moniliophthora roreri (strain MCA 2997) TaxID=1381753 RepID=V2X178_MONRO|nr:hypothetical protein Moror_9812 [Moniliophthora roreri MCA 2997]
MASYPTTSWSSLPVEMKLAVTNSLDEQDIRALSLVDQSTYSACLPALFKNIRLSSCVALENFLENVPRDYHRFIRSLDICAHSENESLNKNHLVLTELVTSLLVGCRSLEDLTLSIPGSLNYTFVSCFRHLSELKYLAICNAVPEEISPLSERFVVSIAASIPKLEHLSLDCVSRSVMHAPELHGVYPYVPLVSDDHVIPDHPVLGSDLYLPALLRIPTLRELTIQNTHLGDPRWATEPVACRLEVLDLGSCCHEDEYSNSKCIQRIMTAVGRTVGEFSLTTSVSDTVFAKPTATPMQRLRKLHISPFFPVDDVVDTMANLAGSPIESLSMQCFEDDVVDVCTAIEEFLSLRVERGPNFYGKLSRIDVSITVQDGFIPAIDAESNAERFRATKHLQEFCRDLRLASHFQKASPLGSGRASRGRSSSFAADLRWPSISTSVVDGRSRSMTI